MTIEERAAKAAENKKSMNCCQAVLLACGDLTGLDEASASAVGAGSGFAVSAGRSGTGAAGAGSGFGFAAGASKNAWLWR